MTVADAAEKGGDGDSGHSQVAIIDLGMVPAERLHPKAAYSRCRPKRAGRTSPKPPVAWTDLFRVLHLRSSRSWPLCKSCHNGHKPTLTKVGTEPATLPLRPRGEQRAEIPRTLEHLVRCKDAKVLYVPTNKLGVAHPHLRGILKAYLPNSVRC